jgi:hypothetical protein
LTEAMDAGEVQRIDPELMAFVLMGANTFVSKRWILWGQGAGMTEEFWDDFSNLIGGLFRGRSS